jgi:hypothetical protein
MYESARFCSPYVSAGAEKTPNSVEKRGIIEMISVKKGGKMGDFWGTQSEKRRMVG